MWVTVVFAKKMRLVLDTVAFEVPLRDSCKSVEYAVG